MRSGKSTVSASWTGSRSPVPSSFPGCPVVLDRSARRLLGRTEAGQTVLINDIEYTISGVVEDISPSLPDVYAEAWVP